MNDSAFGGRDGLRGLRVLISGAGVSGPALAYWLSHHGADTTVVEIAPTLRTSGFAVDFRGPTHLHLLRKMGILDALREVETRGGAMRFVDEHGRQIFELPAGFAGGDIEVRRRDLSRILYERSADRTEYLFGDAIVAATETTDGVHAEFARHGARTFDLLIGADGLHSAVRRLLFGPEPEYVRHLGYYIAGWDMPNSLSVDRTPEHYNVPGRMASVAADPGDRERANAFVVLASPLVEHDWTDLDEQKRWITDAFSGLGWHVPQLLAGLRDAPELYFDSVSRVSVPAWSSNRAVLLGDAAWGVTLGGMGVGTGLVGAYVLAGELAAAGGEHRSGFAAYENRMRPYAARWQRGANPGRFLAPATAVGLAARNALLRTGVVQRILVSSTTSMATAVDLPEYPVPPGAQAVPV